MSYAEEMGHCYAPDPGECDGPEPVQTVACKYCGVRGLTWVNVDGQWRLYSEDAPHRCRGRTQPLEKRSRPAAGVVAVRLLRVRTRDDNHVHVEGMNDTCLCGLESSGDEAFGILEAKVSSGPVSCPRCLQIIKIVRMLKSKDAPNV